MSVRKRKVAVFDVDGTIFRSSLLIQLVNQLIRNGVFPESARGVYERQHKKWLEREGDYGAYIDAMVRAFRKNIKGIHYSKLADAAEEVVKEQQKYTYQYPRKLIEKLKEKDYYLLALSHSPKTILDRFCPGLGFDKVYGTIYEIGPQDRFTGEVLDTHFIYNKAKVLARAAQKETLTLAHSIGMGDTESDIPFLEMVAKPICFNPNKKLYKAAKRNDWKVVVERKDVVYQL